MSADAAFRSALLTYLAKAQDLTFSGGISFGYKDSSPGSPWKAWMTAYPETTGYLIPTLLREGEPLRALTAGRWLQRVQQPEGWIPAYGRTVAAAFDTGAVLLGWLALRDAGAEGLEPSIDRAVQWLSSDAAFESAEVYHSEPPAYWTRIAWPLSEAGAPATVIDRYLSLADNWNEPLSHFRVYEARGLWEAGEEAEGRFRAEALAGEQRPNGSLPALPSASWTCVPAVGQAAVLWARLGMMDEAERALRWLRRLDAPLPASDPINAAYLPYCYPVWSAKFALDASYELEAVDSTEAVLL